MAKGSRRRREDDSLGNFARNCAAALGYLYSDAAQNAPDESLPCVYPAALATVLSMVSCLISAEHVPGGSPVAPAVRAAADLLYDHKQGWAGGYRALLPEAAALSGIDIFSPPDDVKFDEPAMTQAASLLLQSGSEASVDRIYFQTMPLSWMAHAYQRMLAYRPARSGTGLETDRSHRKGEGVYFTPPWLVNYVLEEALAPLLESGGAKEFRVQSSEFRVSRCFGSSRLARAQRSGVNPAAEAAGQSESSRLNSYGGAEELLILDPAMGGGSFLSAAVEYLSERVPDRRAAFASSCVYGVDKDPLAVEIARFTVWAASGYADGISERIKSNLIYGDAVASNGGGLDWKDAFPKAFAEQKNAGFDAVVGNPPYIAAKNSPEARGERGRGQSDFYLLFLEAAVNGGLVKPGGVLSMVLPDPMLVRANAAEIRRKLVSDWTILSILHISEAFEEAEVANVVPTCRNAPPVEPTFPVTRIENAADRHAFMLRPRETAASLAEPMRREVALAQKRCELFYLLEDGPAGDVARQIHGGDLALSRFEPEFAPLASLNVKVIFRGEEVGKATIAGENGDLPILLGGQSIQPFEIIWEGRRVAQNWVRKPLERYQSTKILIQKSAAHVIAALDEVTRSHPGYVFPQSVYAVELSQPGMHELYLLCILNSRVINNYIWATATGYKFLHPQLEIEDIRALPIRKVSFTTPRSKRQSGLAEAARLFEEESLRFGTVAPFSALDNFVARCLAGSPEKSDVVHDLLVHLGRMMVDLTALDRTAPSTETTQRLEMTRVAIETVVTRLYSSHPAQMALPL